MEALSGVLSRVFHQLGLDAEFEGWRAVEDWPTLVGPRMARHTRAVAFREGTLRVEVDGSAWMHELSFLKREMIRRIGQHLGSDRVRDVRFIISSGRITR